WLYSDNANLTERDKESGWLGILRLDMTVMAEITESLHLSITGGFFFLPLSGEAGPIGLDNSLLALIGLDLLHSQITYDTVIGGWPVVFSDDFGAHVGQYGAGTRDDFALFGEGTDATDSLGRYRFGSTARSSNDNRNDDTFIYFSNTVGVST